VKKVPIFLLIFTVVACLLVALWFQASAIQSTYTSSKQPQTVPLTPLTDYLYTSRTSTSSLLTTGHQMLFGPLACTGNGDPYSPIDSPFRPPGYPAGPYTYRYYILIPADYPDNVLRVELFDPDSWNSPTGNATITHTSHAANNGFPTSESMDCNNNGQGILPGIQQNSCLLVTGEETLVTPPAVTIDQINPFWFMRVDESRGPPTGSCNAPSFYFESYNTTTVYQLSYHAQSPDGTIQEVPLASYTGLKNNSHNTDLYWVSPGAAPSFDGLFVPVDAGSPQTFEVNLDTGVPNIVSEAGTGNRYLYLNVTTTDGSSKNGFDIWAGPATYTNSVPSQVNTRNVHLLDNPNSHDSAGVVILADGDLTYSAHYGQLVERPLRYFGPEYAGRTLHLTLFDVDVLSQAPITFTFDTIAPADWSLTFGISGTIDPDGVPANNRCFPTCHNQFIAPPYAITIPGGSNCNPPNCIPFTGGRLVMQYMAGINDNHFVSLSPPLPSVTISGPVTGTLGLSNNPTFIAHADFITTALPVTYTWQADAQLPISHTNGFSDTVTFRWPVPHTYTILVTATNGIDTVSDSHQIVIYPALPIPGCASFPIAIEQGARSVLPPGTGSGNDYPAPGDFHLSSPQPLYLQFPNNVPDVPLDQAQEGHIFKLLHGSGSGSMAWLVWNNGIVASASTLGNSLTVPGNSTDYSNHNDGGLPATPLYPHVVRGYAEPFDPSDLLMHPGDWVTVATGSLNSDSIRDLINDHILNGRELPLLVWDSIQAQGSNTYVRTVQFAVFRLHGHNLTQAGGPAWLLAEFVRWETGVCSEGQYPVSQVNISGPASGSTGIDYDFTATVVPTMTNLPLTYTWQASEQTTITHTTGLTDTAVFNWLTPGPKTITVTAANGLSTVTATHLITISQAMPQPIAGITLTGSITGFVELAYDFTAMITPTAATQPIIYTWQATEQVAITHTGGITDTAVFNWLTPGPKTITVTTANGLNTVTTTHLITISISQPPAPVPITAVALTGPVTGFVELAYDFTALITPTTATQPITYTWQATEQVAITHTGGITDVITFSWSSPGLQTITVTAANGLNQPLTAVHTITIQTVTIDDWLLYLPFIHKP
jgi:hypothetical protein